MMNDEFGMMNEILGFGVALSRWAELVEAMSKGILAFGFFYSCIFASSLGYRSE
jgi:hypothetical protein